MKPGQLHRVLVHKYGGLQLK